MKLGTNKMNASKLEAPFADIEGLGRRIISWADLLTIELFEFKPTGPDEEIEINGHRFNIGRPVGETNCSRVWRLTYACPIAIRVRDENIALEHPEREALPSPYAYASESQWIAEMSKEPLFDCKGFVNLVHTYLLLWDDMIEVLSDGLPEIEEITEKRAEPVDATDDVNPHLGDAKGSSS